MTTASKRLRQLKRMDCQFPDDTVRSLMRAEQRIAALEMHIITTPILVIDEAAAEILGEDEALQYAEMVRKWQARGKELRIKVVNA